MDAFRIIKADLIEYGFIVLLKTHESPFQFLSSISNELKRLGAGKTSVLFDLIYRMGNTSERFMSTQFSGKEFNLNCFEIVKIEKENPIRKFSTLYLKEEASEFECANINSIEKKMILKEIQI